MPIGIVDAPVNIPTEFKKNIFMRKMKNKIRERGLQLNAKHSSN
jgi:hypothetical protein